MFAQKVADQMQGSWFSKTWKQRKQRRLQRTTPVELVNCFLAAIDVVQNSEHKADLLARHRILGCASWVIYLWTAGDPFQLQWEMIPIDCHATWSSRSNYAKNVPSLKYRKEHHCLLICVQNRFLVLVTFSVEVPRYSFVVLSFVTTAHLSLTMRDEKGDILEQKFLYSTCMVEGPWSAPHNRTYIYIPLLLFPAVPGL